MKNRFAFATLTSVGLLSACGSQIDQSADTKATAKQETAAVETAAIKPSFDCSAAQSEAEKLVCSDNQLAELDNEVARLFDLASKDPNMDAKAIAEQKTVQRGWLKGRDDCWKSDDQRACVLDSYAMRIMDLRMGSANARSEDAQGISTGPKVFVCEGRDAPIGTVLLASKPAAVYVKWLDRGVALTVPDAAAPSRYTGKSFDGEYSLEISGNTASFGQPSKPVTSCTEDAIG